jgi:signal peptidase II
MLTMHFKFIGLLSASLLILCDAVSKILAINFVPTQSEGLVTFRLAYNSGVAFGLLPEQTFSIAIFGALFSCYVLYLIFRTNTLSGSVTLGVLLGGVLGNLFERILFGRVTDFISFKGFAVFNIADLAIVLALLLYSILLVKRKTYTN